MKEKLNINSYIQNSILEFMGNNLPMKIQSYWLMAFVLLTPFVLSSQDLHSSNYDYNIMYLNPAESGAFLGTMRVHGSHRDQFDAFIQKGYSTQFAHVDMPFAFSLLKRGWVGFGMGVFTDKSGDLGFKNTGVLSTIAYHYPLDKKYRQVISAGFDISRIQRSLNNADRAKFGDVLGGAGSSSDLNLLTNFDEGYTDYNFGIAYKNILNKRTKLKIGASIYHLFRTKSSLINNRIWRRLNFYGKVDYHLNRDLVIQPRIYASFIRNSHNVSAQTIARYNFQNKIILGGGLGYRVQDALQVLLVTEYKGWEFGLSYDITVSSAGAYNNNQGALELGVKKIFIFKKRPKVVLVEICPRL